jgi:hypothetical protein
MLDVTLNYVATDNCPGPIAYKLTSVTSNEPDNGLGDGDIANDVVIIDDHHLQLRSERSGHGNGRIYTATVMATDVFGNYTNSSMTVTVPHDAAVTQKINDAENNFKPYTSHFEVSVLPNPAKSNFIMHINSGNQKDRISLYVFDQRGMLIENRILKNNETIVIGNNYNTGSYYLKVVQGKEHKVIKVAKLVD